MSVILDAPPVAGNALIASYRESDGTAVVTLPTGFVWTPLSPFGPTGRLSGICYMEVAMGTPDTFIFTSGSLDTKTVIVREIAGLDVSTIGPENDTPNTLAVTTLVLEATGALPQTSMYAMANLNLSGASGGSNTVDQGFELLETLDTTSDTFLAAELVTSATTSLGPTWGWLTSRAAQGQVATFLEAAPPPPTPSGVVTRALFRRRRHAVNA